MRNYQRQQKYSKYRRKTTTVMTTGVNIKNRHENKYNKTKIKQPQG